MWTIGIFIPEMWTIGIIMPEIWTIGIIIPEMWTIGIIIPEIWTIGIIMPIYKNKGDPGNPDSYRGITLVSSVGKVFTSILNSRLTKYADLVDKIPNA
jgi:hypothetical protein